MNRLTKIAVALMCMGCVATALPHTPILHKPIDATALRQAFSEEISCIRFPFLRQYYFCFPLEEYEW